MTGEKNYELTTKALTGAFTVACFAIWAVKNFKEVVAEVKDTQPDEAIGIVTLAATVELPKLWAAFQG